MLNSRNSGVTLAKYGTTLCITYILCNGVDNGLSFQINTLDLIPRILGCRVKGHREIQTSMQSFSKK